MFSHVLPTGFGVLCGHSLLPKQVVYQTSTVPISDRDQAGRRSRGRLSHLGDGHDFVAGRALRALASLALLLRRGEGERRQGAIESSHRHLRLSPNIEALLTVGADSSSRFQSLLCVCVSLTILLHIENWELKVSVQNRVEPLKGKPPAKAFKSRGHRY